MQNTSKPSEYQTSELELSDHSPQPSESKESSPSITPRYPYESDPLYLRQGYDLTSPFGQMVETCLLIIRRHNPEDPNDDDVTLYKEKPFKRDIGMSEVVETAEEEERMLTDEDIEIIRNIYVEQEEWVERDAMICLSGEGVMGCESGDEMDEQGCSGAIVGEWGYEDKN